MPDQPEHRWWTHNAVAMPAEDKIETLEHCISTVQQATGVADRPCEGGPEWILNAPESVIAVTQAISQGEAELGAAETQRTMG